MAEGARQSVVHVADAVLRDGLLGHPVFVDEPRVFDVLEGGGDDRRAALDGLHFLALLSRDGVDSSNHRRRDAATVPIVVAKLGALTLS